jgi:predicted component of viral defense system (DUF524 family)
MLVDTYKKMAGTSAVFVSAQYPHASPVERDGMVWNTSELHVDDLPDDRRYKASMSNALALEGLEDYDTPSNGDVRHVQSMGINFIYFEKIHGWIQLR